MQERTGNGVCAFPHPHRLAPGGADVVLTGSTARTSARRCPASLEVRRHLPGSGVRCSDHHLSPTGHPRRLRFVSREERGTRHDRSRRTVGARGFTLIEVLVVVVILGILAGLIVPRIMDRPDQARVVAAKNDINAIMNALKLYRLDNGTYPAADQGLQALVRRPETGDIPRNWKSGGYLERLPKDPWGSDYQYLNPGIHGEVDVVSLGADRQPGGEGHNADISSWDAAQG